MTKQCANGQIFVCEFCKKIHLEYNNVGIDFQKIEVVRAFYDYLDSLNIEEIIKRRSISQFRRKITVPFPGTRVKLMLTSGEISELKNLLREFITDYVKKQQRIDSLKPLNSAKDLPTIYLN
jgi:hypothetical protein